MEQRKRTQNMNDSESKDEAPLLDSIDEKMGGHDKKSTMKKTNYEFKLMGTQYNSVILMTHFNIFLYALCFWIQTGTLPYLTKELGVDAVMFGYLQTTFAIVQLCGGPLFGRFGDLHGGRAALVLAFASSALGYGLLAIAYNVPLLFLSRLPSVFMHAMQGGQMVVTDMAEESKRADSLGKLGISYGVGMVVGPLIGGIISKYFSLQAAAFVACGGSLVSVILCFLFIPQHTKIRAAPAPQPESSSSVFSVKKIMSLLKHPKAVMLLGVKAVSGVPIGIFQSMFSVIAMDTFHLTPAQNGYIMSYIGILSMIVQGVGIGFLTRKLSEIGVIKLGAAVLIIAYLALAFVIDVWSLCVVLIPMSVGLTLVNVVITSAMTHTVSDADTGAMLGVNMAVNSLIRTVSPTVGGYMLHNYGFASFGYLGFVNSLFVTAFLMLKVPN